ncbi:MAG: glycosyltransferase family 2 protein [Candidatus Scatovivens sp.]
MEKIDILMATYNGEKYIKKQIDSIISQTYSNFNLIISDDASSDNTLNILKEYEDKDKRIKIFRQDKNLGVVSNFEFLLSKVKSEFFMFADQDDIWKENKIKLSINKLKEEDADLVYTDLKVVDENLNEISNSYWKLKGFQNKVYKYNNFESLYLNNYITGCTIVCKSKWIKEILPFPKSSEFIIHDYWLALIVSMNGKISYLKEPTIKYRQHNKNSIGSKRKSNEINNFDEIRKLFIKVKKEHFEIFIENNKKFSENYKKLNKKSLEYFKMLENKKYINFKKWNLFFKLYKYENFIYKWENFIILNIPVLGRILFKMKGTKNGK